MGSATNIHRHGCRMTEKRGIGSSSYHTLFLFDMFLARELDNVISTVHGNKSSSVLRFRVISASHSMTSFEATQKRDS